MYEIEKDPLLSDESPQSLPGRTAEVISTLQRHSGASCPECSAPLCGHETLMSMVMGYKSRPLCLSCVGKSVGRDREILAAELGGYILSKECLRTGWAWTDIREESNGSGTGACTLKRFQQSPPRKAGPPARPASTAPEASSEWNAGDLGCGDLVLELRIRMTSLGSEQILKLTARDPGAPEDLPAWCRLTGHTLLFADPPDYWIQKRKDNPCLENSASA